MAKWEQLVAARERKHLSQMEAAECLNVGLVTYQRWEAGKRRPQPQHMRRLCESFDALLERDESSSSPEEELSCMRASDLSSTTPVANTSTAEISAAVSMEGNNELHTFLTANMTSHLWSLAFMDHPTCNEKRVLIRQAIKEFDSMNTNDKNYQITRREALSLLATLPMITLNLSTPRRTLLPAQYGNALAHCAVGLEACWEMSKSSEASDITLAFQSASAYIPILEAIANNASLYRQDALDLAARYALVKTFLGWQCAGPAATISYAKDAVTRGKETGDISLQLSACSKLAWAYFHDKKYKLALLAAQEAEAILQRYSRTPYAEPLHPCIRGGTYSTLALMQATCRQSPDTALGKVLEVDPGNESYAFMDFKRSNLFLEVGWTYCYQGDRVKSMEWLTKRVDPETLSCKMPQSELGRIATINTMALSSLKAKDRDIEQTTHLWVAGIEGAKSLKSEQRFTDAVATYELMEVVWPGERRITDLRDHVVHWEE
jgi:transcriptional regulator with XRE-family HTH domain